MRPVSKKTAHDNPLGNVRGPMLTETVMLTTTIAKATTPHLGWAGSEPGLLAILAQALRKTKSRKDDPIGTRRFAKLAPVPFAWL